MGDSMTLTNKTMIITGGVASGIGYELAIPVLTSRRKSTRG